MSNAIPATDALILRCGYCEKIDAVLKEDYYLWKCPYCTLNKSKCKTALQREIMSDQNSEIISLLIEIRELLKNLKGCS